jgi:uncharacterized circularly permuted ATP-grasp superfamily protein
LFIPKRRQLEHIKLAKFMETKRLKILHNVKTWWVFMPTPSKYVLCVYKSIVVKMNDDALLSSLLNPLEGPSVLSCGNMELGGAPDFQL